MLVSMDMSMRSSGLIALTPRDEIIGLDVLKTLKVDFPDTEDLIIHITKKVEEFIAEFEADQFVIEGLAFAAKSGHRDVLAGIYWSIRTMIWKMFPSILVGSVPVTSWRSKVLNKYDRKFAKENYTPKAEAIKIATVNKLPKDINDLFLDYIAREGYDKKSIYDLTDAYFLGKYRNSLK